MEEPLLISRDGFVETWTINLPEAGNAITGEAFIDALERAVDGANNDLEVKAVILTGGGRFFSAGGNVKDMAERRGIYGLDPLEQRRAYVNTIHRIPRAVVRCEVPLIAAVNGAAIGVGCDLAMMCDLRVAAAPAFFAVSFVQLGLIPGDGGSWFLPRVVGDARAAEMTLTGDRVDAETAFRWGMVNDVVAPDDLLTTASALAERIVKNPAQTLRMAKRLLSASKTDSLDSVLALAAAMQPLAHADMEHQSRVNAWQERARSRSERA